MTTAHKEWIADIHLGDCIDGMKNLPRGSIDLAFADPPFNIGYEYDVYDDRRDHRDYVAWSREWIAAVYDVLSPRGTFWLAIGDEYAAELKLESQKIGFHCRSWVIWYYTFGVNCARKFTRSHAHLFHFVKDNSEFTFRDDDLDNRVPSARELVYNDKRANPAGRLPDDTWIIRPAASQGDLTADDDLSWAPSYTPSPADSDRTFTLRPQDLEACFTNAEDTWYFPRVAGTFKERAGFHGCQMPEQLLGRIIRTCSNPGDVVLDPFSGSATTIAVAKKLGRQFVGFDVSDDYIKHGRARLDAIKIGDRLDGSAEPLKTARRQTPRGATKKPRTRVEPDNAGANVERRYSEIQRELTEFGIVEAFRMTHDGVSADRVVADPEINREFIAACSRLGLVGDERTWNFMLFGARKAGKLSSIETHKRTLFSWDEVDGYLFASEIAWQQLLDDKVAQSLDEILCDPAIAEKFDELCQQFAPGHSSLEYRWAALKIRKEAKMARTRATVLKLPRLPEMKLIDHIDESDAPSAGGLYVISSGQTRKLYCGETMNLWERLSLIKRQPVWKSVSEEISVLTLPMDHSGAGHLVWQSCLVNKFQPRWNTFELKTAT